MAEPGKCMSEEECRNNWEAQGKPLFGKIWSYEELQVVERPGRYQQKKPAKDLETPANWPKDTVIDRTSKWVFWLPEGWQQGIRTSVAGKILKCYFTPEGKRFWHKKDIEKYIGYSLPTVEPPAAKEEGAKPRTRYVTDPDAIPIWPEDEDDWLPKDFKIAFRQLPSGLHRIFIPPGREQEGFLYHRSTVQEYLSGEKTSLSSFGNSKPMADISAAVAERAPQGKAQKAPKRKHTEERKQAHAEDYSPCPSFAMLQLPGGTVQSTTALPEELQKEAEAAHGLLVKRGFLPSTDLIAIFRSSDDFSAESVHPLLKVLGGLYFRMTLAFNGRPVYQRMYLAGSVASGLACKGTYIFWNSKQSRWQIGVLDEDRSGFALLDEDCQIPIQASRQWMLLSETFMKSDASYSKAG
mmetsp:Transcript_55113/g.139187  ORF Transcript_55113/g.139187 Transcript_55113/m.139187 type:complete len:409 (+) Transcript_55113:90-1316(+)